MKQVNDPERYERILAEETSIWRCDDCGKMFDGPPYYTVWETPEDLEEEAASNADGTTHTCTGYLCPNCADSLVPDDPNDPRRPM